MTLIELSAHLSRHRDLNLRFVLPDGTKVPEHAHVTEIARIEKRFIDCGGTLRNEVSCRLQLWTADDFDHRLTADKLLVIINKAKPILDVDHLEVDVEHELQSITQFHLKTTKPALGELLVLLAPRHSDCLAKDRCAPPLMTSQPISFKPYLSSR